MGKNQFLDRSLIIRLILRLSVDGSFIEQLSAFSDTSL